jgi:DNA polymerase V
MIALVDCNNFYASCERAFDPTLKDKPVIVLSNNDGCVIARSDEAKALGIKMAQPAHMINELLKANNVQVFSSNYTLYGDMSKRVHTILRTFVERIEVYSIDECFLDLSNYPYQDLTTLALTIRNTVIQQTGIPVSVGIGSTKTLAKMANRYAKKKKKEVGVHYAKTKEEVEEMLAFAEVGDVWGIGRQHEKFLLQNGFNTALDLAKAPEEWVRKNMTVVSQRMLNELRGVSCIKWEDLPANRKNICTSRSFGSLVTSKSVIKQAIAAHTAACAMKLRKERSCAKRLHVFIRTNPFRGKDSQYFASRDIELPVATNSSSELIKYAMKGLELIFEPGYNYQKAGVIVLDLIPETQIQLGLFDKRDRQKEKQLMMALDKTNKAFGKDIVRYGVHDYGNEWALKRDHLSKSYTTRLDQLVQIKK